MAILGLKLALLAGAASFAHAEGSDPSTPKGVRPLLASDVTIPPDVGYVVETHPAASPSVPLIIHIQEAHTNYDAQKHLAGILEQLVKDHGLKLILVEGGEGDASLAYLRSYGPPENRRQVAEKYLQLGILSGEEYLDIVSDYPLILWGVEQESLHDQNVEVFLEAESLQRSLAPALASVRGAVDALRPRLSDPALVTLEANAQAFDEERMSLADYADYLTGTATRQGISEEAYPDVARFVAVRRLEQGLDLELVGRQQKEVLKRLRDQVEAEAFARLMQQAQAIEQGEGTREAFYTALQELAGRVGFDLSGFPSLSRYLAYVTQSPQLKPAALAEDLDRLAAQLRMRLASTPEARQLQAIAEEVDLMQKLVELRLSPREYERLQTLTIHGMSSRWADFLRLPTPSVDQLAHLESSVPTLQRFYEVAKARDEALIDRTLAKLEETREPLAVLITGGFHAPVIAQRLKERGLGIVVVTPKVTQPTNERLYHAVLKYKSGHGSFAEVEAAAQAGRAPSTEESEELVLSATSGPTGQGGVRQ